MRKEVEDFLYHHQQKSHHQRAEHLIELGFYTIEYMPEHIPQGSTEADYPEFHDGMRCRYVPMDLTEEEYAAVCACCAPQSPKASIVQKILFVLAIIAYVVGLLLSVYAAATAITFSLFMALLQFITTGFSYLILGSVLLGLSEIIRLLNK